MGPARHSMVLNPKDKLMTAYHEAGHTLIGKLLKDSDPVHKVTIIPRGMALGVTASLPEEDRHNVNRSYCLAMLRVLMAGRAAEEIIYNEYTSGASNDLKRCTQLAHKMVCEWGMSDLGPLTFGGEEEVFLGRDFTKMRTFSEETAAAVDREIHRLCEDAYKDSRDMLATHEEVLRKIAEVLVEKETLLSAEIDEIIIATAGKEVLPEREVIAPAEPPLAEPPPLPAEESPVIAEAPIDISPEGPVPETA